MTTLLRSAPLQSRELPPLRSYDRPRMGQLPALTLDELLAGEDDVDADAGGESAPGSTSSPPAAQLANLMLSDAPPSTDTAVSSLVDL